MPGSAPAESKPQHAYVRRCVPAPATSSFHTQFGQRRKTQRQTRASHNPAQEPAWRIHFGNALGGVESNCSPLSIADSA